MSLFNNGGFSAQPVDFAINKDEMDQHLKGFKKLEGHSDPPKHDKKAALYIKGSRVFAFIPKHGQFQVSGDPPAWRECTVVGVYVKSKDGSGEEIKYHIEYSVKIVDKHYGTEIRRQYYWLIPEENIVNAGFFTVPAGRVRAQDVQEEGKCPVEESLEKARWIQTRIAFNIDKLDGLYSRKVARLEKRTKFQEEDEKYWNRQMKKPKKSADWLTTQANYQVVHTD